MILLLELAQYQPEMQGSNPFSLHPTAGLAPISLSKSRFFRMLPA